MTLNGAKPAGRSGSRKPPSVVTGMVVIIEHIDLAVVKVGRVQLHAPERGQRRGDRDGLVDRAGGGVVRAQDRCHAVARLPGRDRPVLGGEDEQVAHEGARSGPVEHLSRRCGRRRRAGGRRHRHLEQRDCHRHRRRPATYPFAVRRHPGRSRRVERAGPTRSSDADPSRPPCRARPRRCSPVRPLPRWRRAPPPQPSARRQIDELGPKCSTGPQGSAPAESSTARRMCTRTSPQQCNSK